MDSFRSTLPDSRYKFVRFVCAPKVQLLFVNLLMPSLPHPNITWTVNGKKVIVDDTQNGKCTSFFMCQVLLVDRKYIYSCSFLISGASGGETHHICIC